MGVSMPHALMEGQNMHVTNHNKPLTVTLPHSSISRIRRVQHGFTSKQSWVKLDSKDRKMVFVFLR